jgi:adenylate cyclase
MLGIKPMQQLVLIVQSDTDAIKTLVDIFHARGDRVITSTSLEDAGSKVKRQRPDVLLIDIGLFGKNWKSAIASVLQRLPNTKVIFTANGAKAGTTDLRLERGRLGVMDAPFTPYKIETALRSPRTTPIKEPKEPPKPSKRAIRFPIRAKITLPYALLALLLAMFAAFAVSRVVFDTMEERFTNQLIEAGKLSAEWLVNEEVHLLEALRLTSHTDGVAEALQAGDAESIRQLVYPIAVNSAVEAVEILDLAGTSLLSLRHPAGGLLEEYAVSRGDALFADWEFVQRVLAGEQDALGDKFAGFAVAPWGRYLYLAGPVTGASGGLVGAVLVGTSAETIVQEMRQATFAQIVLYDPQGTWIATTFLEAAPSLSSGKAEGILAAQDTQSQLRNISVADIDYGEILGPFEVRGGEDLGILGSSLPESFFVRSSTLTRVQIFGVGTLLFLLVILAGVYIADRITDPLLHVVRASTEVANGNLHTKVQPRGNDEVAVLANSFNHMVDALNNSKLSLLEAYDLTIEGWSKALELRDEETEGHTHRVTDLTLRLAEALGLPDRDLVHIRRGALLHDIGKMAIPDSILNKPGPLSDEEWGVMRKHPLYAHQMLAPIKYLRPALDIPSCHHEKWDGSGYPYGLRSREIPLAARIFAVVDVWDALTSDRPYRRAWPKERAMNHILEQRGLHFDPEIVDLFFGKVLPGYYQGMQKQVRAVPAKPLV